MLKKHTLRITGAVATVGMALALSACGGGSQSVSAACEILDKDMKAIEAEMDEVMSGAGEDLGNIGDLFAPMIKQLGASADKISNAEVKAAANEFKTQMSAFSDVFADLDFANLDPTDEEAMAKFEEASTKMNETSKGLEAATDKITELCDIK